MVVWLDRRLREFLGVRVKVGGYTGLLVYVSLSDEPNQNFTSFQVEETNIGGGLQNRFDL